MIQKSPQVSRCSGEATWRRHQVRQRRTVRWPRYQHTIPRSMVHGEFTITKIHQNGEILSTKHSKDWWNWTIYNCIIMWTATMILTYFVMFRSECLVTNITNARVESWNDLAVHRYSRLGDEKKDTVSENDVILPRGPGVRMSETKQISKWSVLLWGVPDGLEKKSKGSQYLKADTHRSWNIPCFLPEADKNWGFKGNPQCRIHVDRIYRNNLLKTHGTV